MAGLSVGRITVRRRRQQRHFSAVVYLNDAVQHFDGGAFAFQPTALRARSPDDGTRQAEAAADADTVLVTPAAGRVVLYDARLRHCVQPVQAAIQALVVALNTSPRRRTGRPANHSWLVLGWYLSGVWILCGYDGDDAGDRR